MNDDNNVLIKMLPGGVTDSIIVRHGCKQHAQDLLNKVAIVIGDKAALIIGTMVLNGEHIISATKEKE